MKTEERYHVMTLTPRQQATIRLLLFNLFCSFVQKNVHEVVGKKTAFAEGKTRLILDAFNRYDEFTSTLCSRDQMIKGKQKLVQLSEPGIRYIILAFGAYDPSNCYLAPPDISFVKDEFNKVFELAKESSKHSYSRSDLKKGGVS